VLIVLYFIPLYYIFYSANVTALTHLVESTEKQRMWPERILNPRQISSVELGHALHKLCRHLSPRTQN